MQNCILKIFRKIKRPTAYSVTDGQHDQHLISLRILRMLQHLLHFQQTGKECTAFRISSRVLPLMLYCKINIMSMLESNARVKIHEILEICRRHGKTTVNRRFFSILLPNAIFLILATDTASSLLGW